MHLAEPDTSLCRQIYALETGLGPLKCNEKGYGSRFSGYLAFYSHVRWSFSKRQSMLAYSGFLEKNGDSSTFPHFRPAIFFPRGLRGRFAALRTLVFLPPQIISKAGKIRAVLRTTGLPRPKASLDRPS